MTLKREQREDEENKRMSAIKLFMRKTETYHEDGLLDIFVVF